MERKKGKGRGARREAARVTASALVTQPGRGEARRGDSGAAACENDEDEARAPLAFTRGLSFRARNVAATRSTTPRRPAETGSPVARTRDNGSRPYANPPFFISHRLLCFASCRE